MAGLDLQQTQGRARDQAIDRAVGVVRHFSASVASLLRAYAMPFRDSAAAYPKTAQTGRLGTFRPLRGVQRTREEPTFVKSD
jgi:hypothetical protein